MTQFKANDNEALGTKSGSNHVLAKAFREPTACNHENNLCTCNTSDQQRAKLLREFVTALAEAGWPDVRMMPLDSEGKAPIIQGRCSLDSDEAQSLLANPEEAVKLIREGAKGFCLYAGKSKHGTEGLVFTDHDDPDRFPADANTLTTVSGSGTGYHQTFKNTGDIQNAKGKGKFEKAGEVRAYNQYIVLPGSIHPTGGIYHVDSNLGIGELEPTDLPKELLPSSETPQTLNSKPVELDTEVPDSLGNIEADFNVENRYQVMLNSAKSETIEAIIKGALKETRFKNDRHQAEGWLAEQVGFYMGREREVIEKVLTKIFRENPKTDAHTGSAEKSMERKFFQNDHHREQILDYATSKGSKYDPGMGIRKYTRQKRPEVSYPLFNRVNDALADLVLARTNEIVEHPRVDRGKRQVQNALRKMQNSDEVPFSIHSVKDGRKRYYYLEAYELKIPEDRRKELGIEVGL